MRPDRLLIGLLLLATALVDCAVLCALAAGVPPARWPDLCIVAAYSLASSQVNLAAIWAGLGKKSTPWRLTGAVLVAVLWNRLLGEVVRGPLSSHDSVGWLALQLTRILLVVAILSIAGAIGVRVVRGADGPTAETSGRSLQFYLSHLFAWTTATAVVLGVVKWLTPWQWLWPSPATLLWWTALNTISTVTIPFATLWAALGGRSLTARMIPLLAIPAGLVVELLTIRYFYHISITDLLKGVKLLFALETLLLFGSLWVFRVAGYRLTWIRR